MSLWPHFWRTLYALELCRARRVTAWTTTVCKGFSWCDWEYNCKSLQTWWITDSAPGDPWTGGRLNDKKGKGIVHIRLPSVPELIPVLGSQLAGDVSHKPGGVAAITFRQARSTLATLKRIATNFAAWWTETRWVWTVCLRLLPDSVAAAIWTQFVYPASVQHVNNSDTEPPFIRYEMLL